MMELTGCDGSHTKWSVPDIAVGIGQTCTVKVPIRTHSEGSPTSRVRVAHLPRRVASRVVTYASSPPFEGESKGSLTSIAPPKTVLESRHPPRPLVGRTDGPPPSLSSPVGGRVSLAYQNWPQITDDRWVLDIVKFGHLLEFQELPQFNGVRSTPI